MIVSTAATAHRPWRDSDPASTESVCLQVHVNAGARRMTDVV